MLEPLRRFPDDDACRRHVQKVRWGEGGYVCQRCGETERWGWLDSRNLFQCHHCGQQCSITAGTVMQNTKLPLRSWFVAAHVMHAARGACRSTDLARLLGIWPEAARSLMRKLGPTLKTEEGRRLMGLDLPTQND